MNIGKFKGWAAKAYPKLRFYRQSENLVYLSDNGSTIQCEIRNGDQFIFPGIFENTVFTDDYQIALMSIIVWGSPKVEYNLPVDHEMSKRTYKEPKQEDPNPEEDLEISYKGRQEILEYFRKKYRGLIQEIEIPGGSVEIVINNIHGPILYDLGLTPGQGFGHCFTPYSHQDNVKNIIEDFIKKLK